MSADAHTSADAPTSADALAALHTIVGAEHVVSGDDAAPALVDWRGVYAGDAIAVVRPSTTADVAAVVRWCSTNGIAVVCQGGNTSLSGGATPASERPTIVLSLQRMRRVEAVDADRFTITVEAGCSIEQVQDAAAAAGLMFAPDWSARGTATVGGAIATNAGGMNVLRFGTMRAHVLGLEVVLPDGRVWNGLRALRKDSSGYDLKQLFVGSEGTLGVVTRAVLALQPAERHATSALGVLHDLADLAALFGLGRQHAADVLSAFELVPELGLASVCEAMSLPRPLATIGDWYVLVRFAGTAPVDERLGAFLVAAAERRLITDAVVAATPEQEARLWLIRDELNGTRRFALAAHGVKMDAAVPIDRIVELIGGAGAIAAELAPPGSIVYPFGHVGDGNVHLYVVPSGDDALDAFAACKPMLAAALDDLTIRLGGSLSAEHGVGRELRDRLDVQKSAIELELMRAIKRALDPANVMNPGILLTE
jgi:FAD/FMN-containing dehydrogenase